MILCFCVSYSVAFVWAIARTKIPITMIRAPTQPCQRIAYPSVPKISIHTMKHQKAYVPLQPIPKAAPHIEAPLYQNLKDQDANTPLMKNIQIDGSSTRASPPREGAEDNTFLWKYFPCACFATTALLAQSLHYRS